MTKYKYTTCSTNKDSQCSLQPATENMEGKEETAAEASYFSTVLIVAMRILYESISRSHQLE